VGHRIWRLLSGIKAKDLTGLQIQKVASGTYMDSSAQSDLSALRTVSNTAEIFAFKGGLPQPDSFVLYEAAAAAGGTGTVKPSDIFAEDDAGTYVCVLLGGSIQGTNDNIVVTPKLYDGAVTVDLCKSSAAGPATQVPMNLNENSSNAPIYFTEDTYLAFTESGGSNTAKIYLRVAIMVRGGNP